MKTAALFILAALLVSCSGGDTNSTASAEPGALTIAHDKLLLDTVRQEQATEKIHLTGSVQANPATTVQYTSLVQGVVTKVYFELGDFVTKNQLLAEVISPQNIALETDLSLLQSRLAALKKKAAITREMLADGLASQRDSIEIYSEIASAEAELQRVYKNMKLYGAGAEKNTIAIRAPRDGFVVEKNISEGQQLSENSGTLFTVSNLQNVWVVIDIFASSVSAVQKGMNAEIQALSYPGEVFRGTISSVANVLDSETRSIKARIEVNNPGLKLKPGMVVDAVVVRDLGYTVLTAPQKSIIFTDNKQFAITKANGGFQVKELSVAKVNSQRVNILSGLQEGDVLVTQNNLLLFEELYQGIKR